MLRKVAALMLPFYAKIAANRTYAAAWARAVREADLSAMEKLLRTVLPPRQPLAGLATNGIGYFIDIPFPKPVYLYTNATSLRPGQVQFTFSASIHRQIAAAVLPFYRELAGNPRYAAQLAVAIRRGRRILAEKLVRSLVTTRRLKSVQLEWSGVLLGFQYPSSPYVYYNELFREYVK
ncbi:hypothetical protein B5M42_014805 [Paenibacillus athensensis]|uniref:Uncharacterized protein n=2 Tax=Paenibacillus athensensis TaxID=1967502 RepID=A0A4Y8Q8X6_9BACL|nr:hypothetical protein [Paenibacillus athensensis]